MPQLKLNPCKDVQHYYSFDHVDQLNLTNTHYKIGSRKHLTLFGAREQNPLRSTQITLTDLQIKVFANKGVDIVNLVEKQDFRKVFMHTNPNSKRVIHTFMAPPKKEFVKPVEVPSTDPSKSMKISQIHGGGCCGWKRIDHPDIEIANLTTYSYNTPTVNKWKEVFGDMLYSQPMGMGYMFFANRSTYSEEFNYFMATRKLFRPVYSFVSSRTGRKVNMYAWSSNEVKS